jgi:Cu-processing system ATP-binding protein
VAAPRGQARFRAARRQIGYLPENVVLYDNLTAWRPALLRPPQGRPLPNARPARRVGLAHAGKRPVREYSKGMRQRLGFAQALLGSRACCSSTSPPTASIPGHPRLLRHAARRRRGVTVVITSHILAELQERVDRLAIMAAGKIQALGSVQALREAQMPLTLELDGARTPRPAALRQAPA